MKLNVLIVSSQRSLNQCIKEILLKESVSIITFCDRLNQIEEECKQMTYDMMIVNEDSIHDFHNLMIYHKKFSCIIVCLKHQVKESYLHQCKAHHMVILMKPIKIHVFTQILQVCIQSQLQMKENNQKLQALNQRYQELKIIHHAKYLLMEKEHLKESQAHRMIEKQAMDKRCSKLVIAQRYIKKYEEKGE